MKDQIIHKLPFVKNDGIYYDINFTRYYPKNIHSQSLQSSYILAAAFATLDLDKQFIARATEIQNELGVNRTLWGLRLENGSYSLEFYFHHPKKFEKHTFENLKRILTPYALTSFTNEALKDGYYILSYNLDNSKIEGLNVYYPLIDPARPVAEVGDAGFALNTGLSIAESYYFTQSNPHLKKQNTYFGYANCIRDFYDILQQIYSCCRELFPGEDPIVANTFLALPYIYDEDKNRYFHPYCLAKKANAMGVYFMGFSFKQYLSFLKHHQYSDTFIQAIVAEQQNLNHLQFDIGIDFSLENGKFIIKKTAHFGTF